jgi:hypothetical protein
MGGILPLQRPFIQPTPVVMLTFCSSDQLETYMEKKKGDNHVNAGSARGNVTRRHMSYNKREVEKWDVKMTSRVISAAYQATRYYTNNSTKRGDKSRLESLNPTFVFAL